MFLSRRAFSLCLLASAACRGTAGAATGPDPEPGIKGLERDPEKVTPITRTDEEWKAALSADSYKILRTEGTERAFSGRYAEEHREGEYDCAGCGLHLFSSTTKFDSGTGWPSFYQPFKKDRVTEKVDAGWGMVRTEVECARCGGHLGHVFDDGPQPTGLRYCMNSGALVFRAKGA